MRPPVPHPVPHAAPDPARRAAPNNGPNPAPASATAQRALTDATLALLVGCVAVAMFLPPWVQATTGSLLRTVGAGLVVALALPLHWVFLGIAARRMHRSVAGWVGLSLLLVPVGSAAALILLAWLLAEPDAQPLAAR